MAEKALDEFTAESIRLALAKMFRPGGWFDICTVKKCLEAAGVDPPRREMQALDPLHCVHFSEMTPAMRRQTLERTLALFRHAPFDVSDLETPLLADGEKPAASGWLKRLTQ